LGDVPKAKGIDSFMSYDKKSVFFEELGSFKKKVSNDISMAMLETFLPLKPRPGMLPFLLLWKSSMWKVPNNPIISFL
jgi:hypothetical protein